MISKSCNPLRLNQQNSKGKYMWSKVHAYSPEIIVLMTIIIEAFAEKFQYPLRKTVYSVVGGCATEILIKDNP